MSNNKKMQDAYECLISLHEKCLSEVNNNLCSVLKEYCGGMEDNPEYYVTEKNSEAISVMCLERHGYVKIIKGRFPKTKRIKFIFNEVNNENNR